jgi:hypothetical protein
MLDAIRETKASGVDEVQLRDVFTRQRRQPGDWMM